MRVKWGVKGKRSLADLLSPGSPVAQGVGMFLGPCA